MNQLAFFVAAASNVESADLVKNIRNFIAPILLLVIGIVSITFLLQRQITQFLQFFALAIGVTLLFYVPNVLESLAQTVASWLGQDADVKTGGKATTVS